MLEQPGNLAVVVLALTVIAAHLLAAAFIAARLTTYGSRHTSLRPLNRLLVHTVVVAAVAIVFWLWAAIKTYQSTKVDWGVVTFVPAIFGHVEAFELTMPSRLGGSRHTVCCIRWLCTGSALGVAANYAIVCATVTLPETFQRYLIIGGTFWAIAALRAPCVLRDELTEIRSGREHQPLANPQEGMDDET